MAYITAYQSLFVSARLEVGESVLIHAASGGVGQAAIMLPKQRETGIYITVGTEAKRDFIMQTYGIAEDHIFSSRDSSFAAGIMAATKGKGVDVILNSLAGSMLKESWNCFAHFGRFIEIGKRDIEQNKFLEMAPLRRAASFVAIDLNHIIRMQSHSIAKAIGDVMSLWSQGHIKAPTPITQFPMSEMTNALRLVQSGEHIGKVLCIPRPGDLEKVCIPHFTFVRANSELTTWIKGCARHQACSLLARDVASHCRRHGQDRKRARSLHGYSWMLEYHHPLPICCRPPSRILSDPGAGTNGLYSHRA